MSRIHPPRSSVDTHETTSAEGCHGPAARHGRFVRIHPLIEFTIRTNGTPTRGMPRCSRRPVPRRTGFDDRVLGVHETHIKFWEGRMTFILWLIAVVLVISGIVTLVRGQMLFGILLIVVGLLVGPGGGSIFNK